MPRRVRPDDGDARPLANTGVFTGSSEASDRIDSLAHAPLLARHRIHEGEPIRVPARGRQERPRGRIVGGHEAAAAFAAAMAA